MRSDARCLAGGGGGRQGLAGRVAGLRRGVQREIVPKPKRPSTAVSQSSVQYATPLGSYPVNTNLAALPLLGSKCTRLLMNLMTSSAEKTHSASEVWTPMLSLARRSFLSP